MEFFELLIVAIITPLVGFGGLAIGKLLDPIFQCKMRRQFLRENVMVLGFVSKDRRTVDRVVVNTDGTRINYKNSIIAVDHDRIYREDKPSEGLFYKKSFIKYDEAAPTLYLYADSLKPADFYTEPSKVSAQDVVTVLISFVRIEMMKNIMAIKNIEMLIIVCLLLSGLAFIASSFGAVMAMDAKAQAAAAYNNTQAIVTFFHIDPNITSTSAQNGTIVVRGT
jgi:hypothetical protein